jgi:hypothetical protein
MNDYCQCDDFKPQVPDVTPPTNSQMRFGADLRNGNIRQRRPFNISRPIGGSWDVGPDWMPTLVDRHLNRDKPALTQFIAENTGDQTAYCQCNDTCANNCVICAVNGPCKAYQITNLHDEATDAMDAAMHQMICENCDDDSSEETIPPAPTRVAPTPPVTTEEPTIETIVDPELITTREPRFHPLRRADGLSNE